MGRSLRPVWTRQSPLVPYEGSRDLCDTMAHESPLPYAVGWTTVGFTTRKDGLSEVCTRVNFCAACVERFGLKLKVPAAPAGGGP